jgi:hypothetical protein
MFAALRSAIRPGVPYITLVQHDEGLDSREQTDARLDYLHVPNLLVLSAGGYGHVAVPLLKQPEAGAPPPMLGRPLLASFVGTMQHAVRVRVRVRVRARVRVAGLGLALTLTLTLPLPLPLTLTSQVRCSTGAPRYLVTFVGGRCAWRERRRRGLALQSRRAAARAAQPLGAR